MGPNGTWSCKGCARLTPTGVQGFCGNCINEGLELLKARREENAAAAKDKYNAAILRLSFRLLDRLLGLDSKHQVVDVIFTDADRKRRTVLVVVQGPGMYNHMEGMELPQIDLDEMMERIRLV
jgi:hypothetical protein